MLLFTHLVASYSDITHIKAFSLLNRKPIARCKLRFRKVDVACPCSAALVVSDVAGQVSNHAAAAAGSDDYARLPVSSRIFQHPQQPSPAPGHNRSQPRDHHREPDRDPAGPACYNAGHDLHDHSIWCSSQQRHHHYYQSGRTYDDAADEDDRHD